MTRPRRAARGPTLEYDSSPRPAQPKWVSILVIVLTFAIVLLPLLVIAVVIFAIGLRGAGQN